MRVVIEPEEFQHLAVNLQVGHTMRADHSCMGISAGTLMITREAHCLSAYCFRCGGKGRVQQHESMQEKLARLTKAKEADALAERSLNLPGPWVEDLREWPRAAGLWLYKVGFSPHMIEDRLRAYYCPSMGRVVLPVYENGKAIFWQARAVDGRQPKILSPKMPRLGVVGKYGAGDELVLTEDTLSAVKVSYVTEAWSLLGTKLLDKPLTEIMQTKRRVCVWLDGDKAGRNGDAAIVGKLRAYGVDVRSICTPKDPKTYTREQIRELLHV